MAEARTGEEGAAAERQVTNAARARAGRHRGAAAGGKGTERKSRKKKKRGAGARAAGSSTGQQRLLPRRGRRGSGGRPEEARSGAGPWVSVGLRRPLPRSARLTCRAAPRPKCPASLACGCRRIMPREVSPFAGQFGRLIFFSWDWGLFDLFFRSYYGWGQPSLTLLNVSLQKASHGSRMRWCQVMTPTVSI